MLNLANIKMCSLIVTALALIAAVLPDRAAASRPAEGPGAGSVGGRIVSTSWGETRINGTPTRVVALEFSFVDQLVALGVTPVALGGIGETRIPEYLSGKVKEFTYVGERKDPDLAKIRSVNPDLIIANPDRHQFINTELSRIAPTIALDDRSYSEILSNVTLLGDILGRSEQAATVKKDLEATIESAKRRITNRPTVLVVGASTDGFTVWIKDSFLGSLMAGIGTSYAYTGTLRKGAGTPEVSRLTMEELARIDPEYLFVYGDLSGAKANPLYRTLRAVRSRKVAEVNRNLWSRGRGPVAAKLILEQALPVLTAATKK